jgi:hypothetical protein
MMTCICPDALHLVVKSPASVKVNPGILQIICRLRHRVGGILTLVNWRLGKLVLTVWTVADRRSHLIALSNSVAKGHEPWIRQ